MPDRAERAGQTRCEGASAGNVQARDMTACETRVSVKGVWASAVGAFGGSETSSYFDISKRAMKRKKNGRDVSLNACVPCVLPHADRAPSSLRASTASSPSPGPRTPAGRVEVHRRSNKRKRLVDRRFRRPTSSNHPYRPFAASQRRASVLAAVVAAVAASRLATAVC